MWMLAAPGVHNVDVLRDSLKTISLRVSRFENAACVHHLR